MAKEIKLTKEELNDLIELRGEVSNLYVQVGQIHLQRKDALSEFDRQENELIKLREELSIKETKLYNTIGDKYGQGNVNLETGVFTPISEV